MPAFVKKSQEELAHEFAKFMKHKKVLKSNETSEFFEQFGMRPKPPTVIDILKKGFSKVTFIECHAGFFPDCMSPASLKGYCYYDVDKNIAYFSDVIDMVLFKLLCDTEMKKIVQ